MFVDPGIERRMLSEMYRKLRTREFVIILTMITPSNTMVVQNGMDTPIFVAGDPTVIMKSIIS
jgi:ABC-type uncharacterized transport system substrate-binding protein